MEHRRRASDCGPACDSAERGLDPSASVVLAIEDASRDADSARLGPEKAQKSRVILGTGAILPVAGDRVPMHAHEPLGLADAVALGDVVQDRGDGLLGQAGAEQRGALALGEASLARVAVEQSELLLFAVVAADREVFSAPSALVWAVGIQAAEP